MEPWRLTGVVYSVLENILGNKYTWFLSESLHLSQKLTEVGRVLNYYFGEKNTKSFYMNALTREQTKNRTTYLGKIAKIIGSKLRNMILTASTLNLSVWPMWKKKKKSYKNELLVQVLIPIITLVLDVVTFLEKTNTAFHT